MRYNTIPLLSRCFIPPIWHFTSKINCLLRPKGFELAVKWKKIKCLFTSKIIKFKFKKEPPSPKSVKYNLNCPLRKEIQCWNPLNKINLFSLWKLCSVLKSLCVIGNFCYTKMLQNLVNLTFNIFADLIFQLLMAHAHWSRGRP